MTPLVAAFPGTFTLRAPARVRKRPDATEMV